MPSDAPQIFWKDFAWITRVFSPSPSERDHAALRESHQKACKLYEASALSKPEIVPSFLDDTASRLVKACDTPLPPDFAKTVRTILGAFAKFESALFAEPPRLPDRDAIDLKEEARLREHLRTQLFHLSDVEEQTSTWAHFTSVLILLALSDLPPISDQSDQGTITLSAPLITLARDPAKLVETIIGLIQGPDAEESKLYHQIQERIFLNMMDVNRITPDEYRENPKRLRIRPEDLPDTLPPDEAALAIFKDTPFADLLLAEIPVTVPEEVRFEHMHILAGTGHGKTQTLQHLIVNDLQRPANEVPSMVILDSQGDMLNTLKRMSLFDPRIKDSLSRRLLIVDPSDVHFAPALNLFDIQSDRLKDYNQRDREQVLAGIIEIYDYIFGGLLGAELSQKQAMVFRFLAQLMLAIPGATIHTLRDLLIDATPFMDHIAKLPATARGFFETQFFERGYNATREQILRRLYGVLQNPSFERMFAQPQNRLDLFDELNNGGIVLVNTAKDFLKSESSSMFGRYIIALTLKAAFERATLPHHMRRPTYLWIDEASEYFDDNIDNLLIQSAQVQARPHHGAPISRPASTGTSGFAYDQHEHQAGRRHFRPRRPHAGARNARLAGLSHRHDQRTQANQLRRLRAQHHTPCDEAHHSLRHRRKHVLHARWQLRDITECQPQSIGIDIRTFN